MCEKTVCWTLYSRGPECAGAHGRLGQGGQPEPDQERIQMPREGAGPLSWMWYGGPREEILSSDLCFRKTVSCNLEEDG